MSRSGAIAAAVVMWVIAGTSGASAREQGRFSLEAGFAVVLPARNAGGGLESRLGYQLGMTGLYRIKPWWAVGGMVEWENYGVEDAAGVKAGTVNTVSLMPATEFRYSDRGLPVSPFLRAGLGTNLNFFSESGALGGSNADLDHTVALKVAGGLDIYPHESFMLRLMAGWKMNRSELAVTPPGSRSDFNASTMFLSVGFGLGI